jgi:hypothetical protein
MPVVNPPSVVNFDVERVVGALLDEFGGDVLTIVEYDRETYNTLYVADAIRGRYPDEETMEDHFAGIHAYVYLDFTESDLFEDLFVASGGTRAFVTYMRDLVAIRVVDGSEGVFVSVTPDVEVSAVVELVEGIIR